MKCVGNLRPQIPKYNFIWDVEQVLKYLRFCHPLQVLDTGIISLKLTMLTALTSTQGENEIKKLDIQYMVKTNREFTFSIAGVTKTRKQGKKVPGITFHIFPEEESICPYKTLEHYLEMTQSWRIKGNRIVLGKNTGS